MSHVTEIKLKIKDLDALEDACDKCGLELVRDQKTFKWWGKFVGDTVPPAGRDPKDYGKCDHAIRIKDARPSDYEIGLVPALDGEGYDLMVDTYHQPRLMQACGGKTMPKLHQEYGYAKTLRQVHKTMTRRGWKANRVDLPSGAIQLQLRKR